MPALAAAGWTPRPLVRGQPAAGEVRWDPSRQSLDAAALDGVAAAVHLAGEPIAEGRWTAAKKLRIQRSRTQGTRLLAESLAALPTPPRVLVSASAVGIYGDRGDEILDEHSPLGSGFLADVGKAWEAATGSAAGAGIRIVHVRLGIVLARQGGALAKMLPAFRLGAGGPLGTGRQWMSWIALEDAVSVILAALGDERIQGPVNAVAPDPVRNADFTSILGRVLNRPAVLPVPAFGLRLLFGEMADEALLASQRVVPTRLRGHGFEFGHPALEPALRSILDR